MKVLEKITPCLWFDDQAEEAANFYISVFPNSKFKQFHASPGLVKKFIADPAVR